MNDIQDYSPGRDNSISMQEVLALIWEGKLLLLVTALVGIVLAGAYLWLTAPVYQVDALVQIEENAGGPNAMLGEMGSFFDVASPAEAEIAIIKSRMVLGAVVKDLQLDVAVRPVTFPIIGPAILRHSEDVPSLEIGHFQVGMGLEGRPMQLEIVNGQEYKLLLEDGIVLIGAIGDTVKDVLGQDSIELLVRSFSAGPGQRFAMAKIPFLDCIEKLESDLYVAEEGKKSGIVMLALQSYDAGQAAAILNAIAMAYVQQNVDRKSAEASKTLQFLRGQIPELKAKSEYAETRLNEYRLKVGSIDLNAESQLVLNQGVDLDAQLLVLQQQRADLLRLYKKDHSTVRTLDKQIAQLYHEKNNISGAVKKLPKTQQEIVRLAQEAKVTSDVYNNVLNSAQQLEVTKAGQVGNVRVIDYAIPKRKPIAPQAVQTFLMMILSGLVLGTGIVLFRRYWSRGVEDPKELERNLGLPVYAIIPHSEAQHKFKYEGGHKAKTMLMLSSLEPDDLAVEAFRSLRTTLHFSMHDAPNNVLLLVGPSPNIGKSFVSSNLAAIMAQSGKRVCLVDADLRCGMLHKIFGKNREMGLSEYLSDYADLKKVVRFSNDPNLAFVSTGQLPPNPSELLLGSRTEEFIQDISRQFDLVLVDSPPLLAVADAMILGKLAGSTLMVLRHGTHRMVEIEQALARLDHAAVKVKGCIFNDVLTLAGAGNGYGARYGYVYQYSYKKVDTRS